MTIKTKSTFYYGHTITLQNQAINFDEGGGSPLTATIDLGEYTLNTFADAVASAMNLAGTQEYSVSVDRFTRTLTISAPLNFSLLPVTGADANQSAFELMGFTVDVSGSNSYAGDSPSGSAYSPQFLLQRYVDFTDDVETNNVSVNESASGRVEVVSYGQIEFMTCNITFATDIVPQGVIEENPTGVKDLNDFMRYLITKAPVEFIPDRNNPNVFTDTLLERTPESQNGTSFRLRELYARNLTGYFEPGTLRFRKIV